MIRILVYEDEPEVVQALVNAFANGLKPGEEIEIIWFETGFDPPRKKSIQPGEPFAPELNPEIVWFDTRDPRRERPIYPIKVEAGYEPWLIRIETQHAAPTWPPQERGKCEWHQEEFREVILDIYHEPSPGRSTEVGRDFADWFELANFRGPRSVITRRGRPLNWPIKYKRFHKKEDPDWDVKCVDKTLSELRNEKEQQIAGRIEAFHVDCLGRNPTKFLSDFDAQSLDAIRATTDRVNERIPKDWHALYFGPDRTVADYLCKYFRLRLYTNKARAIAPISELAEVLLEINQLRGEKPRVVWLDFGEEAIFDNKSATELADTKCIKREGDKIVDEIPVFPPKGDRNLAANLVFFILAKEERVSSTLMETFERCNVFFVSRSDILKHPHVWTVINVGELADSYANFSREYQLAQGEIVEKTIRDRWKVKFRRGSLNPRSFSSKPVKFKEGQLPPEITLPSGFPSGTKIERRVDNTKREVTDTVHIPAMPWPDSLRKSASLVVKNLPPVLMIAKSMDRIQGSAPVPVSLAAWVSADAAKKINTGFGAEIRDMVERLKGREISDHQAAFVTRSA